MSDSEQTKSKVSITQKRREELLSRRKDRQDSLKLERQQASLANVLTAREALGVEYEVLWPDVSGDPRAEWSEQRFPIVKPGRIDWARVPRAECWPCRTHEDFVAMFSRVLGAYLSTEHTYVIVFLGAGSPSLRLSPSAAVAIADELLVYNPWVYQLEEEWLSECYELSEICAGHAPNNSIQPTAV